MAYLPNFLPTLPRSALRLERFYAQENETTVLERYEGFPRVDLDELDDMIHLPIWLVYCWVRNGLARHRTAAMWLATWQFWRFQQESVPTRWATRGTKERK